MSEQIEIYKTVDNQVELRVHFEKTTVWLSQKQIASLFGTQVPAITKHIKNILKEGELTEEAAISKMEIVQKEGKRQVKRNIEAYNLDMIISVGYRVSSLRATQFRIWATERLRDYLTKGYNINKERIQKNKEEFIKTVEDLKILSEDNRLLDTKDVLSLIQNFSDTWFSLEQFDSQEFPSKGTKKEVELSAKGLERDLAQLKQELIKKGQATELFGQEKNKENLKGIFGNIFQTVFGEDAYKSVEEKQPIYFILW